MRRIAVIALVLGLASPGLAAAADAETRQGYLMPTRCKARAGGQAAEKHTTECALEEACVASGFGLIVGEDFLEFDDAGDQLALEYFQGTEKVDHHIVDVTGDFSGAEVQVESVTAVE